MGPGDLARALCGLEFISHPNLLVGLERADDAGVYKLTDDIALIQTMDFFTPIVDDPYRFGQVAVANALSDVYAMGGTPICAMNIVCFPAKTMDIGILREILRGGLDKMREAQVVLAGGHSIDDPEIKYGLSVTGTIDPRRILTKQGAQAGDAVILTKPLGSGVVNTAQKRGKAAPSVVEQVVTSMATLNKQAMEILLQGEVHGCTDITGFGLVGHACEMLEDTGLGMSLNTSALPLFPQTLEYAAWGLKPGGLKRNREYRGQQLQVEADLSEAMLDLLFDPQTSGGLLATMPPEHARTAVQRLQEAGISAAAVVGEVVSEPVGKIVVR